MTRRVLFPGWTPVRTVRKELRAANAIRGKIAMAAADNPVTFKSVRLVNFILDNYTKKTNLVQALYDKIP